MEFLGASDWMVEKASSLGEPGMATYTQRTLLQPLRAQLLQGRENTDRLFGIVRQDALYERPIPERHRIVFYIGHLEAFDWNLFREHLAFAPAFSARLDKLFAFGIDPVDGSLPRDAASDWPSLDEVREYVGKAREAVDALLDRVAHSGGPEHARQAELLVNVAAEHRWMHAETLTYMFHQMPYEKKHAQAQPHAGFEAIANESVRVPAGSTTLGMRRTETAFGWDNEFEEMTVEVPAFSIDKLKISNAEFSRFVDDGGYRNKSLWAEADWNWKEQHGIEHPAFWVQREGCWAYRGMFEESLLPSGWPVYVSHAEASAYARWAGKALPTEAQWQRAAYGAAAGAERAYPWGDARPDATRGNLDFHRWDPVPVDSFAEHCSGFGAVGMLGNGWEWTSTIFGPLPGFEAFSFYPGYSANFFDGKHFVLKGASARTAAALVRKSFRNWFQAHYQYVYAGFRCVNRQD